MNEVELGEISEAYKRYEAYCKANGLFPNGLSVEFFDWMEGAA